MKSDEFITETMKFKSRPEWHQRMQELGAREFLNDIEFDAVHKTDLVYAIGEDGMLKGTWSNNRNVGTEFKGAKGVGMKFDKGRGKTARKFQDARLSESLNETAQDEFYTYEYEDHGGRLDLEKLESEDPANYDSFSDYADDVSQQFDMVSAKRIGKDVLLIVTTDGGVIITDHQLHDSYLSQLVKKLQIGYKKYSEADAEAQADSDAEQRDPHGYRGVSPTDFN